MRKFWAILIIVLLILGAMVLITYLSPAVREYAQKLATDYHLPLIIVGLFAPILKLWQAFTEGIGKFLGGGDLTEIEKKNSELETRLKDVEQKVGSIYEWRKTEIDEQKRQIDALNKSIEAITSQKASVQEAVSQTEATPAVDFATGEKYDDFLHDLENDPYFVR